jgi:DedD protein
MAFFKFRKTGAESDALAAQPESIEALRKRAKQRLIGASILVLVGVIGFPLVFDTQPRPIPVDIPIEIPDRGKPAGATNSAAGAVSVAAVTPAPVPPVAEPVASTQAGASPASAAAVAAPAPTAPATPATPVSPAATPPATPDPQGERARALLEGKPASAAADGRFVVQVGAFADVARAREARAKLEKAGLKTYTQVVETKEGKRIRVRVGPFDSRAEADSAATKVKGLELPATVLTL